jgi:uridylate kinase
MRVLLKISWEALKWERDFWIDPKFVSNVVSKIKEIKDKNIELAIVVWGWNIYRWSDLIKNWVDSSDSHNLSMLSTVFNWVVLKNFLEQSWFKAVVMDPNWINFVEKYNKNKAREYLESWVIVICTWGTSNPYFTTDTGWVLRSLELKCDMMIKATKVDWIYDKDPVVNPDAKFFDKISYDEVIRQNLKIMDQTAVSLAKENNQILKVVNMSKSWAILNAIEWKKEGTTISL